MKTEIMKITNYKIPVPFYQISKKIKHQIIKYSFSINLNIDIYKRNIKKKKAFRSLLFT